MECVYRCIERLLYDDNIGPYKSYGIKLDIEVNDISTDREFVEKLVQHLNKSGADPKHLGDIVEDYIATTV